VDVEDMPDHVGVTLTHESRTDPYYAKAEGFDVEMRMPASRLPQAILALGCQFRVH
jgi:hypothetical protein